MAGTTSHKRTASSTVDMGALSPRFHRGHHTSQAEGLDRNVAGLFPWLDVIFGTYRMPAERERSGSEWGMGCRPGRRSSWRGHFAADKCLIPVFVTGTRKFRVGIHPRQSLLVWMLRMKSASPTKTDVAGTSPATETIVLTGTQADYLQTVSRNINPEMHRAFGLPHAIRTILDRIEASGIDLTAASSEDEITTLAAGQLRRGRAPRPNGPPYASASRRSTDRPDHPWILPVTDRRRSEKPPR
jgi:hypothetical protein